MTIELKLAAAWAASEGLLRALEHAGGDKRAIAVTRTHFETAFLWAANAVGGESLFGASDSGSGGDG